MCYACVHNTRVVHQNITVYAGGISEYTRCPKESAQEGYLAIRTCT